MLNKKTILGIIPARGGSKGIPRKNIRKINGIPLIAWTCIEAKKSKYIDELIISSEDQEIISIAKSYEISAPFIRPKELANDHSPVSEVVMHALHEVPHYDYIVLLQITSPLRTASDIDQCIETCINQNVLSSISVTKPQKSPYWMYKMDKYNTLQPLIKSNFLHSRRQEHPNVYIPNGAVYVVKTEYFWKNKSFVSKDTTGYIMPKERSLDIDDELDIVVFESILKKDEIENKNKLDIRS